MPIYHKGGNHMTKQEFLSELRKKLNGIPCEDIDGRINFYDEMIDDRIEDGLSEEEAISGIGTVDEIVVTTMNDIPIHKFAKEKLKRNKKSGLEITLLVLGAPVWIPLLISAIAVVLSVYVSVWAIVISLWSIFASLIGCAVGGIIAAVIFLIDAQFPTAGAMFSAVLICAGLSIFMFYGCRAATNGAIWLGKKMLLGTKFLFIKKEEAK